MVSGLVALSSLSAIFDVHSVAATPRTVRDSSVATFVHTQH